jgi:hypothetical protein
VRILLVEPYFTGSHQAWAQGYATSSRHEVELITHDGKFWKWRMQGGPVTLALDIAGHVAAHGPPDLLLASSMTDLAGLLGIARRELIGVPTVLYMHENQLTYPLSPRDDPDATYAMTQWKAMAAADLVVFNSDFHRTTWFEALPGFLRNFPDHRHDRTVIAEVAGRTEVLPVGVDLVRIDGPPLRSEPPLILWNQRCEHDKAPEDFVAAMIDLAATGASFTVALAGERFVSEPSAFDELRTHLGDRITHDGFAADAAYVELLRRSDIVVSTARQEFFGIAITEAIYGGAFPLLPAGLVYPERIPARFHDDCLFAGRGALVEKLAWALRDPDRRHRVVADLKPLMAEYDWAVVAPMYDERFARLGR